MGETIYNTPIYIYGSALVIGFLAGFGVRDWYCRQHCEKLHKQVRAKVAREMTLSSPAIPTIHTSPAPAASPLPVLSGFRPTIIPLAAGAEVDALLSTMREKQSLRELTARESGVPLNGTPAATYFFVHGQLFQTTYDASKIQKAVVNRKRNTQSYFEVNRDSDGRATLVAFISSAEASTISNLDGMTHKRVTLSPIGWEDSTTIIVLPIERIVTAVPRVIQYDTKDGHRDLTVLDCELE